MMKYNRNLLTYRDQYCFYPGAGRMLSHHHRARWVGDDYPTVVAEVCEYTKSH
jgi:hypothetical protein